MIARIWRAWATPAGAGAYERYFREALTQELLAVPGCLGAHLLRRGAAGEVELSTIVWFESMAAVRGFTRGRGHRRPRGHEAHRRLTGRPGAGTILRGSASAASLAHGGRVFGGGAAMETQPQVGLDGATELEDAYRLFAEQHP